MNSSGAYFSVTFRITGDRGLGELDEVCRELPEAVCFFRTLIVWGVFARWFTGSLYPGLGPGAVLGLAGGCVG